MSDLPQGWEWATIGEVADIQLGRQRSPKNHAGDHMRPYLRSANVTWDGLDLTDVKQMNFEPVEVETFRLEPGDLLLNEASGSPGEVGKPVIWRGEIPDCCFQNTLLRLRSPHLSTEFLYWYCRWQAASGNFGEAGRGVHIRHLGKQGLAVCRIPVAPRSEQERVVAAIEEHFSRLDAAGFMLTSATRRLGTLRRRLLDITWLGDPPTVALGDVLSEPMANGRSAPTSSTGFPVLRLTTLKARRIDLSERKLGAWNETSARPFVVKRGDFFVSRGNGSLSLVGRGGLLDDDPDPVAYPDTLIRVRTRSDRVDPRFLSLVWDSNGVRQQIERAARTTAGIYKVNQATLGQVRIPCPALDDQTALAAQLEEGLAGASRLAYDIGHSAKQAAALRRSILAAAFAGKLVPQDPRDEPATVLLERIRAERMAAGPRRRTRRVKA